MVAIGCSNIIVTVGVGCAHSVAVTRVVVTNYCSSCVHASGYGVPCVKFKTWRVGVF